MSKAKPAIRAVRDREPFWKRKRLEEMTRAEWESLCDGCGRCCLMKLEYEDTGGIDFTNVACRLLDHDTCRCSDYANRRRHVEDCIRLTPRRVRDLAWLPPTCGYRLVDEGRDLYWWHPLVSGDPETVHLAGVSVRGRVLREGEAGALEDHIVRWPGRAPPRALRPPPAGGAAHGAMPAQASDRVARRPAVKSGRESNSAG